jgi:biotin transporter BioY
MLVFGAVGVPLVRSGRVMAGPLIGFLAGSAVAAVVALVLMVRTARRADWAVYSAM